MWSSYPELQTGPPKRHRGEVGGRVVAVRPVLSERCYGSHDYRGRSPPDICESQTQGLQMPGRSAIDQHVGPSDKSLEHITATVLRQIQGDAALAGVVVPEEEAAIRSRLVLIVRLVSACKIAGWRLHLYDVGAHVAEHLSAPSAYLASNLQDSHPFKDTSSRVRPHIRSHLCRLGLGRFRSPSQKVAEYLVVVLTQRWRSPFNYRGRLRKLYG